MSVPLGDTAILEHVRCFKNVYTTKSRIDSKYCHKAVYTGYSRKDLNRQVVLCCGSQGKLDTCVKQAWMSINSKGYVCSTSSRIHNSVCHRTICFNSWQTVDVGGI